MRETILESMARTYWVTAWADAAEAIGKMPKTLELFDVAPDTPPVAVKHAQERLAAVIELNGQGIADLYSQCIVAGATFTTSGFGHLLAMQDMGQGVGLWDDMEGQCPVRVHYHEGLSFHPDEIAAIMREMGYPREHGESSNSGKVESEFSHLKFDDSHIVNLEDWEPKSENTKGSWGIPHMIIDPSLPQAADQVICIVFAEHYNGALDAAADDDRLDVYKIHESEIERHRQTRDLHEASEDCQEPSNWSQLGNDCVAFDIECLRVIEMPNPPASWCAQFNAMGGE